MLEPGPNTMMLIYNDVGRAVQTIEWPFPQGMAEVLAANGQAWVIAPKIAEDGSRLMIWDLWVDVTDVARGALVRPEGPWTPSAPEPLRANGEDAFALSGLPVGSTVRVGQETYTVDDGQFELTSAVPTTVIVEVSHWPHRDTTYEVEFTDAN